MKNRLHPILALVFSVSAIIPIIATGQLLRVEGTQYDPPGVPVPAQDRNRLGLSVNARSRFIGERPNFRDATNITVGCFMNTLERSTNLGRDWRDIDRSCTTNTQYPPDYPTECAHAQGLRLIEEWERSHDIGKLFVDCYQVPGPVWTIERCHESTLNNRYLGWSEGGLNFAVVGLDGAHHEFQTVPLPEGEAICHRHFQLYGSVRGLEHGDVLRMELEAPDEAGTVKLWDIPPVEPWSGTSIQKLPQIPEGASYEARIVAIPQKKTCAFDRNDQTTIVATFAHVDDSGRTSGGIDLTDLSITCSCNDGQESCAPDGVLNVEATGIEAGESASLAVQIQPPSGGEVRSDSFPVPRSGTFTIVSNIPQGSSYTVTFASFSPVGKSCTVTEGAGTMDDDGAQVHLSCACPAGASGTSRTGVADAVTTGCLPPGGLEDIIPVVQIHDLCLDFGLNCVGLDPWWWSVWGPPTGSAPCQGQTVCVDGPDVCHIIDGEEICTKQLICTDRCLPQGEARLGAPFIAVDDGLAEGPVSGQVLLTGFANDADGLGGMRFFLDGEPLALEGFAGDVFRPESCTPIQGDCDPNVGFRGLLDTTQLSPGPHRLVVFAVDGNPAYPMHDFREVVFEVENACSTTAPPVGNLVAPLDGVTVAGPVPVEVAASSPEGIERVRFYLDGVRVFTDWTAPYAWNWQTTGVADGQHRLHADVLDTCGNVTTIAERTVTVRNANDLPALAVETPTPLVDLAGIAPVSGWALDEDRVSSIVLRLDGQNLPLASPLTWTDRSDVCSSAGIPDPRCPNVGWSTSFDTTRWPDGSYRLDVVAVDGRGGSTSRSVWLSIRNTPVTAPTVSTPASRTVVAGEDVSFQVTGAGEGPLSYQWQYRFGTSWRFLMEGERGGRVRGVLTRTLTIADVVTSDATAYRCLVSNDGGTTASGSASLTVQETIAPPTATAGLDERVTEGETAFLSVSAQGAGPLSFRWQRWNGSWVDVFDGGRISGSATSTLAIVNTVVPDQGLYRVLVSNEGGTTISAALELTVDPIPVGTCVPDATTLCFQADRFAVTANFNGSPAWSMPFSEEGGFFWAFEPNTVEVVVKVLDGRGVNGHFWVFHGALTDLAYTLTVTDTITGVVKTYLKGAGHFCGDADTAAFGGSTAGGLMVPLGPASIFAPSATCQSSPTAACLFNDKFRVEVHRASVPQPGVAVTELSASFGFVSAYAPEVVVKVIDGTSVNGWYWLFFGSLTHQAFTVEVTDTATGEERSYASPDGFCGGADTTAF